MQELDATQMKAHIHLIVSAHDRAVVERDDEDEQWVRISVSDDFSIAGALDDVQRWVDELHLRVSTL
jgi:hypothetical protein